MKDRILFIATFPPPVHGSAVVSQYIKDSTLINDNFQCDYVNLSTSKSMDELGKNSPVKILRLLCALSQTLWKLLRHRYDLCYLAITCHGLGFLKDAPFVLLCRLFRRKLLIHQHNKGMSYDIDRWPYCFLMPLCYRNARVILLSWKLYGDIEKVVPKEKVLICPNGIPSIDYVPCERNNEVTRLFFLSNLIPFKGVYVLLDALKVLNEQGLNFICDVVGGETKDISRELFEEEILCRHLEDKVRYWGRKDGDEKRKVFENADIFVHPTMNDCFPLVLLEAMQYGLPIVTTNIGGITDIVKDEENGIICQAGSSESLAKALLDLINDKTKMIKMGENGYRMFQKKFTVDNFEKRLNNIICEVIGE